MSGPERLTPGAKPPGPSKLGLPTVPKPVLPASAPAPKPAASAPTDGATVAGNDRTAAVQSQLAQGRMVLALVKPGFYTPSGSQGHYVVVTKIEGGKAYLNDPMKKGGPIVFDAADFGRALDTKDGRFMAVGNA